MNFLQRFFVLCGFHLLQFIFKTNGGITVTLKSNLFVKNDLMSIAFMFKNNEGLLVSFEFFLGNIFFWNILFRVSKLDFIGLFLFLTQLLPKIVLFLLAG